MLGELLFKLHLNSYHVEHSPYMLFRAYYPRHSERSNRSCLRKKARGRSRGIYKKSHCEACFLGFPRTPDSGSNLIPKSEMCNMKFEIPSRHPTELIWVAASSAGLRLSSANVLGNGSEQIPLTTTHLSCYGQLIV